METGFRLALTAVCAAGLLWSPALAQEEALYQRMLDEKAPAIVTIKSVLKVKMGGNEQEMESENAGVMIDPKGLVLCSNSRLGGAYGLVRRLMGSSMSTMTINPTDIKVIVGDAADGVDAKFIARDTELDLAWIQVKEPGDKPFAYVDLARSTGAKIGQKLLSVYRTSKSFDRTPVIMESLVGGAARKPRELFLAGDLSPALGLPAFTADGTVVAVSILQIPESDDEASAQHMRLAQMANSQEFSGALLPVAEVIKATTRAKETAETQESDESESEESTTKPADDEDQNADEDEQKTQ